VPARSFKERRLRFGLPAKVDLDRNIKPENPFPRKPQFGVATAEQVHVSAHRDRIVTAIISLVIPKVCAIVLMLKIHDRWLRDQIRRSAAGTAPPARSSRISSTVHEMGHSRYFDDVHAKSALPLLERTFQIQHYAKAIDKEIERRRDASPARQ
jgi:hypothetical protein